jgi:aminoglycoside/choline kinase family phosphotransferase
MDSQATLSNLFRTVTGLEPEQFKVFPSSGSNRRYFRISAGGQSFIGVAGTSVEENKCFITMSEHFLGKGINVPHVLAVSDDFRCYIQEDLGDDILFDILAPGRERGSYNSDEVALLKRTVAQLPRIQFLGAEGLDWSVCYPLKSFSERMVDFDLNYFKYCFLKPAGVEFNENRLQDDFELFKAMLMEDDTNTFLYRDFQARNVMIRGGEPWFIDFQGGLRGPIYYDLASFVWQARSRFPEELRKELVDTYLAALQEFKTIDSARFHERLHLFVLFRTLQVLGCYGFRGWTEKKAQFVASIPPALDNLRELLKTPIPECPYLCEVLSQLVSGKAPALPPRNETLVVDVYSFSYKKGIPEDTSDNGGGYVFDCRAIHNPGRYDRYKTLNGTDAPVIQFLEADGQATVFLDSVYTMVDAHVKRFIERGFSHLQVSFGCTGGQHRSVYCAEHLAEHIARKFNVRVNLTHREMKILKSL